MSRYESSCLEKIGEDRVEIDRLIRELDLLKNENVHAENEQIRLIDEIAKVEHEVKMSTEELTSLRQ